VATDASSFILHCRNKNTPNPLAKMHRERWKLCRKVRFFYFVKLYFNKKLKAEVGLYLIYPRTSRFTALENLSDGEDIYRTWGNVKENIKTLVKRV